MSQQREKRILRWDLSKYRYIAPTLLTYLPFRLRPLKAWKYCNLGQTDHVLSAATQPNDDDSAEPPAQQPFRAIYREEHQRLRVVPREGLAGGWHALCQSVYGTVNCLS
jgi:hypothetical protein